MNAIRTTEDLYAAIDRWDAVLRARGHTSLAASLRHRVHIVSWTTRDELLREIQRVLAEFVNGPPAPLPDPLRAEIDAAWTFIQREVGTRDDRR